MNECFKEALPLCVLQVPAGILIASWQHEEHKDAQTALGSEWGRRLQYNPLNAGALARFEFQRGEKKKGEPPPPPHAAFVCLLSLLFSFLRLFPPHPRRLTAQPDLVHGREVDVCRRSGVVEQRRTPGRRGGGAAAPPMVAGPRERDGRELLRQRRRGAALRWHRRRRRWGLDVTS
jgi:hypothetical protein